MGKIFRSMFLVTFTVGFILSFPSSAGERFTEAGNALGIAINQELIKQGYCGHTVDCHRLIEIYGGHGNQVNFTAYGIGDKNRDALSVIVGLIARQGIRITGGIPIRFQAYYMSHDDYVNRGVFRSRDVVLTLEVTK